MKRTTLPSPVVSVPNRIKTPTQVPITTAELDRGQAGGAAILCRRLDEEPQVRLAGLGPSRGGPIAVDKRDQSRRAALVAVGMNAQKTNNSDIWIGDVAARRAAAVDPVRALCATPFRDSPSPVPRRRVGVESRARQGT